MLPSEPSSPRVNHPAAPPAAYPELRGTLLLAKDSIVHSRRALRAILHYSGLSQMPFHFAPAQVPSRCCDKGMQFPVPLAPIVVFCSVRYDASKNTIRRGCWRTPLIQAHTLVTGAVDANPLGQEHGGTLRWVTIKRKLVNGVNGI